MNLRPRLVRHCRPSMTQMFEQQPSLYSPSPIPGIGNPISDKHKLEDLTGSVFAEKDEIVGVADSGGDRTFCPEVFDLLRVNAEEIAQQITLMDLKLFKAIEPDELTSCAWSQPKHKNDRAPNIVQSTRRFNHINFWVQREILYEEDIQKRAQVVGQFIKICRKLVDMNNLQSAMSVLAALQSAPIHRLERTWAAISKHQRAAYEKVSELFSESNNREHLRVHMASIKLPCIPYLGLYLTDLTYIDVAHPSTGGIESQARLDKMNNILRVIADFQRSSYRFTGRQYVQTYILEQKSMEEFQKFEEDANFKLSKQLEPPSPESCANDSAGSGDGMMVTSLKPSQLVDPAGVASRPSCVSSRSRGSMPLTSTPAAVRINHSRQDTLPSLNLAPIPRNVELRQQRGCSVPKSHRKSKSLDNELFGPSDHIDLSTHFFEIGGRPQLLRHPLDDSLLLGNTVQRQHIQPANPALRVDTKLLRSVGIDGPAACSDLTPSPTSNAESIVHAIAGSVDLDKTSESMGSVEGLVNGRGLPACLMSASTGSGAATSVSSAVIDADTLLPSAQGYLYPGETMPEQLDIRPTICEGCLKRKTLMKSGKRQSPWKIWRRLWIRLIEWNNLYYLLFYRPKRSFSTGTDRDEFRSEVHAAQCLRKTLVTLEGEEMLGPSSSVVSSSPVSGVSPNPSPARASSFSSRHRFSIPFSHARHGPHQLTLKVNDLRRQNSHTFRKVGRSGLTLDEWQDHLCRSIREMEDNIERRDLIQLDDP